MLASGALPFITLQHLQARVPDARLRAISCSRLLVWSCLTEGHAHASVALRAVTRHPGLCRRLREGSLRGLMFYLGHDRGTDLGLPSPRVEGIDLVPVRYDDGVRVGHDVLSKFYKIAVPLLFPSVDASVYLDGDITVGGEASRLDDVFAHSRFGFVVTAHPHGTWLHEPMSDEQRAEYAGRGVDPLLPLTMNGVIVRAHADEGCLDLTRAWLHEYGRFPHRDQPALVAAVHQTGRCPLIANELLMSWSRGTSPYGNTPVFLHGNGNCR
jgi:hypothetical protein